MSGWDGSQVIEAFNDGRNAIRIISLDSFKAAASYWGKANAKIPKGTIYSCASTYCSYKPNSFIYYDNRKWMAARAYQIYKIGADYTITTAVKEATAGNEYFAASRGMYRCDTFVRAVLWSGAQYRNANASPMTAQQKAWQRYVAGMYEPYSAILPRIIFDKVKAFQ